MLPFEGDSIEGEATLPIGGESRERVTQLANEVRSEPIPPERKARIEEFHQRVLERLEEKGD